MKISDAYKNTVKVLTENNIENAAFEADCLIEYAFSVSKAKRFTEPDYDVDCTDLLFMVGQRISGEPLQYIIGSWDFCGFTYKVGRGVLIPRPETEMLVEKSVERLKKMKNSVVYDLCAGSGCIGLSVARLVPDSKVYLFEKSFQAYKFLAFNALKVPNVTIIKADILSPSEFPKELPNAILSNPPYIQTDEIKTLQTEVLKEPEMALDGGTDGLEFYRVIANKWLELIKEGGFTAVECGEEQAEKIADIFSPYCKNTFSELDFNNIKRVVIGEF